MVKQEDEEEDDIQEIVLTKTETPDPEPTPGEDALYKFLSSLKHAEGRPPFTDYFPNFEELGVSTKGDLLALKSLTDHEMFLKELRRSSGMNYLQSLVVHSGLQLWNP